MPVAHGPFRHYGRFAGESAVAAYYIVHVVAVDEVVVDHVLHLAPPCELILLVVECRGIYAKAAVGHAAVGLPLNPYGRALAFLEIYRKFVAVGIPSRAPSLFHYRLVVYVYGLVARVVHDEVECAALTRLNLSFVDNF